MRILRLIRAALREIFDEAAYERFCARQKLIADKNSYRGFLRDRDQDGQAKIRCC